MTLTDAHGAQPGLTASSESPQTGKVVVLVPAHNEENDIATTVASIHRQTRPVDRIIVVCDNCTDRTEEIVRPLDCEVFFSRNNRQKKAGALNQALMPLMSSLSDDDCILVMDADSELSEGFVESACRVLAEAPVVGAVCAAYVGKSIGGCVPLLQRMEYLQERRRIERRQARVNCLSGVATVFRVSVLRHLISQRGHLVPGRKEKPEVYLSISLTEDFEITMALRTLGYEALSPRECTAYTDLMPTVRMLWSQRLRWQRGTLETLRLYGITRVTARMCLMVLFSYCFSLVAPFMFLLWALSIFALHTNLVFTWWASALFPLAAIEQMVSIRKMRSWRCGLIAAVIVPLWLYTNFKAIIYWCALLKMIKRTEFQWD